MSSNGDVENESRNEVREANIVTPGMYWISIIYREAGANCDRSSRKKRAVSSFSAADRRRYRILSRQQEATGRRNRRVLGRQHRATLKRERGNCRETCTYVDKDTEDLVHKIAKNHQTRGCKRYPETRDIAGKRMYFRSAVKTGLLLEVDYRLRSSGVGLRLPSRIPSFYSAHPLILNYILYLRIDKIL